MKTANSEYQRLLQEAKQHLQTISEKLEVHSELQKNEPKNWGYVGDIGRIVELLKATII